MSDAENQSLQDFLIAAFVAIGVAIIGVFLMTTLSGGGDDEWEYQFHRTGQLDFATYPIDRLLIAADAASDDLEVPADWLDPRRLREEGPFPARRLDGGQLTTFQSWFDHHYRDNQRRLLHVTLDRPLYQPGQPLRWRSWHLPAGVLDSDDGNRSIQVELRDPGGGVVHSVDKELPNRSVWGQFDLDEEAPGGEWTFRIIDGDEEYTRPVWIARFEPPRFNKSVDFTRRAYRPGQRVSADIEVLRDTGWPASGMSVRGYVQSEGEHLKDISAGLDTRGRTELSFTLPRSMGDDATLVLTVEEGGNIETGLWPIPMSTDDVVVDFFPEGGRLVDGLATRVYFEATDASGQPVDFEGVLIDSAGEVVAPIETIDRGRGRFEFTPDAREYYQFELSYLPSHSPNRIKITPEEDGQVLLIEPNPLPVQGRFELPPVEDEGCVLRVFDDLESTRREIRAGVQCSTVKTVAVYGAMGDQILDAARVEAGPDRVAAVHLRPDDWPRPAGVVRLTVSEDVWGIEPLAERVIFYGRRAQMEINLELDSPVYHPGDTVRVEITATDPAGRPMAASLARGVVDDRLHNEAPFDAAPILAQLLLMSDDLHFWADVDEAKDYFDLEDPVAPLALDLLMGVRGWRSTDKLDAYYVDGGDETITAPPRLALGQPRHRAHPDTIRDEATIALFELDSARAPTGIPALSSLSAGGSGASDSPRRARRASAAQPQREELSAAQPAPPPRARPDAEDFATDDLPGLTPFWHRDDDAAAFASWNPEIETGRDGKVVDTFQLPEAMGAYRITVEGISDRGLMGSADALARVELPMTVSTRLPESLFAGDVVQLPVTIRNSTQEALPVSVQVNADGPVTVNGVQARFDVEVPGRETVTRFVEVQIDGPIGDGKIQVWAEGGGFADGATRTFQIDPAGYLRDWNASGSLPGQASIDVPLSGMTDAGARGRLTIYTSPAAEALEGLEAMARRPTGCFEQTSSANHPNILVWRYLDESGALTPELDERLRAHIDAGYRQLKIFELSRGGFSWFRSGRASIALTAWGLIQFFEMANLVDDFDRQILVRTSDFLRRKLEGSGQLREVGGSRITRDSVHHFVLYAMARTGHTEGLDEEFEDLARRIDETDDPYELALATAALTYIDGHGDALTQGAKKLRSLQRSDGGWTSNEGHGWAYSRGNAFGVETTGLATLALIRAGGSRDAVSQAVDWLADQRTGRGWWGSTKATIMALEARIAYEGSGLANTGGTVTLEVGDELTRTVTVDRNEVEPVVVDGFASELGDDTDGITISSEVPLTYDLDLRWRVEEFDAHGESPLQFAVEFAAGQSVQMGDEISLAVDLRNTTDQDLGMTLARIALPSGMGVPLRELTDLVERTDVAYFETHPGEVILYFEDFDGDEHQQIRFSAIADVPGDFEVPASVAYAYYRDESQWQWDRRRRLTIVPPH